MKNKLGLVAVCSVGILLSACSGSGGGGSSSSSTNEFSSLLSVTGPVTNESASSFSSTLTAATGVLLSNPGTFTNPQSLQMCENVNYVKEILREASSPDKILCYMSAMRGTGVIPTSVDLTDGEAKYIKLVNLPDAGGGNSTPYVKVQIVKSGSSISSFKMWSCFNGTAGSPVQSEYISQTFSGTTATVTSKYLGTESDAGFDYAFGSSMTASGSFADNAWESKNINGYRYYSADDGTTTSNNVMTLDMDQYADALKMSIAMKGKFGDDTFINKFYTEAAILGSSLLSTFAIGDGSSKYSMSYDQDSDGGAWTDTDTISWDGDNKTNLGTASNGDHYTTTNAGTIPADPDDTQTVSFSGTDSWDCTLPSGQSWTEADFEDGGTAIETQMAACEDKFLGDGEWIQCNY